MSWGKPGKGKWITRYSNPGHVFMVVAGVRFDTSGTRRDGSRWQKDMRPTAATSRDTRPASDGPSVR